MTWLLVAINIFVYVAALYLNQVKGTAIKIYFYFFGLQVFLILGRFFINMSASKHRDPSGLGSAYESLLYYLLQGLVFNVLVITFLIKTLPASASLKVLVFVAVIVIEFMVMKKLYTGT